MRRSPSAGVSSEFGGGVGGVGSRIRSRKMNDAIVNSEVGVCHALSYGLSVELGLRHGIANCIAFNVLDEYCGPSVARFRAMRDRHQITLPRGVCRSLDAAALDRMVEMTWRMERPLINAFGPDWKQILTREKIMSLYKAM